MYPVPISWRTSAIEASKTIDPASWLRIETSRRSPGALALHS